MCEIRDRISTADYIVAPIADNRMFEILDAFAEGEITDQQCGHALSATDLGMQHVFKSKRALDKVEILERCFLCDRERSELRQSGLRRAQTGKDKAKVARRKYRSEGSYVEELLDENA